MVFEVRTRGDAAPLVCKRLGPRASGDPALTARLLREAEVLRILDGRGAPVLRGAGQDAHGPWLVMDRAGGEPLASYGVARPGTRWRLAARRSFDALAMLHERGVVHADLSPANVMVTTDASAATLVDLGLAVVLAEERASTGTFRGTLAYAAPEVARGEPFDARADLFSLAAAVLATASGEPLRPDAEPGAMLLRAGSDDVTPWAERASRALTPALPAVLVACCAFDPSARPATARDVAKALG